MIETTKERKEMPDGPGMGGMDGGDGGGKPPGGSDLSDLKMPPGDYREDGQREQAGLPPLEREQEGEGGDKANADLSKEQIHDAGNFRENEQAAMRPESRLDEAENESGKNNEGVDAGRVAEMEKASDNPAKSLTEE